MEGDNHNNNNNNNNNNNTNLNNTGKSNSGPGPCLRQHHSLNVRADDTAAAAAATAAAATTTATTALGDKKIMEADEDAMDCVLLLPGRAIEACTMDM